MQDSDLVCVCLESVYVHLNIHTCTFSFVELLYFVVIGLTHKWEFCRVSRTYVGKKI